MKKIIFLSLLIACAFSLKAQHITPRVTHGTMSTLPYYYYPVKDTVGVDTLVLKPTAYTNLVWFTGTGDTLAGNVVLTVNARSLSYLGDQMTVMFKTAAKITDTVRFAGYIQAGSTQRYLPVTANTTNILLFTFNGSVWVLGSATAK